MRGLSLPLLSSPLLSSPILPSPLSPPPPTGRLHLRVRARELRVEARIESRIEIDGALATARQAVEVGAGALCGAGRWWLERSVREVVRGEVERLEDEHC